MEERILVKKVYNSSGSIKERIIYVDDNFVRVVNSSGSFDFTYVMHEGQNVAEELNGVKKFTITDHLGSTGAVTDADGTVVEQTTYSPYGEIIGEIISGGSSVNKSTHITKKGNGQLRQIFHMLALVHIAYKTEFSDYYFKLKGRGKHPKKCIIATARKLAVKCYFDLLKCHDRKI